MANRRLTYGMEMYRERAYPDWMLGCFDHFGYDQADETDRQRFVDDLVTYQTLLATNTYEAGYRGLRLRRSIEESELELAELPTCEWKVPNRSKKATKRIVRLQRRGSMDSWWLQPTEQRRRLQETFKRACFEAITKPSLMVDEEAVPDTPPTRQPKRTREGEEEVDEESKTFWDRYYAAQRTKESEAQERRDKYWQSPDLFVEEANEEELLAAVPIIRFDDLTDLERLPKERERRGVPEGKTPDLLCLETMRGEESASRDDTIILSEYEDAPPTYSPISSAQQSPMEVRLSRARRRVELWERRLKASELAIEAGKTGVDRLIVETKGRTLMTPNHEARMERLTRLESTADSYRQSLRDARDELELLEEASNDDCYVDGEDSFTFGRMTDLLFD